MRIEMEGRIWTGENAGPIQRSRLYRFRGIKAMRSINANEK